MGKIMFVPLCKRSKWTNRYLHGCIGMLYRVKEYKKINIFGGRGNDNFGGGDRPLVS